MVLESFHTDALKKLCTKDQLDLLDSIDSLRSQGISHFVSLPQIIVCGDQSSGKSSVLEAISGVSFPIKSNLCTRFPTELILRKTSHVGVKVSIVPHHSRTKSERSALSSFDEKLDGFDALPSLIEDAKAAMGILTHGKAFSKDLLRVEVTGPDKPHLTIVDLPGLVHSETKHQSASDVELVRDVVQLYMKEPRSIILAVISAKNDCANQIVLKLARAADKRGVRTLGVITKPDTLKPGSESEATYVSLAKNQNVEFRLGWHVLKNMDSEAGQSSLVDRGVREHEFFSQGIWEELPSSMLGVDTLRDRLSKLLLRQIAAELPSLIEEIGTKTKDCRRRMDQLGEPRATLPEQQHYLIHISQSFQSLVKAAVDGTYNDPFFEDAMSDSGYHKRIRAVIQNLNQDFKGRITTRGHYREITSSEGESHTSGGVIPITRDKFVEHIRQIMQRTRGRELPGTFNPMIVADLFLEQASPWKDITLRHVNEVWKAAREFLRFVVIYIADAVTSKALFQKIFEPALNQLKEKLDEKSAELLIPHQKSHPITYNSDFTETLQKVRNERNSDEYSKILTSFFGITSLENTVHNQIKDLRPLLAALLQRTEPDMNRFACSEALDCMEAYYKVALNRFTDDIAVEVVESKLISRLGNIFSPIILNEMSADLVTSIAGESEENRALREQLTKQLDVLTRGSDTCKRFMDAKLFDANDSMIQLDSRLDNDSSGHWSGDDNDPSDDLVEDDAKSLSDRSVSARRSLSLERPVSTNGKWTEAKITPEPLKSVEVPEDNSWGYYDTRPKKSKKSKVSGKVALFEPQIM